MPSLPMSLLIVGLVVAWLVVLVPMLSKGRESVPESDEDVAGFRVLRRSRTRRRPRAEMEETMTADAGRRPGVNPDFVDTVHIERGVGASAYDEGQVARSHVSAPQLPDGARMEGSARFDASDEWAQEHSSQTRVRPMAAEDADAEPVAAPRYRAGRGGFDPEMARRMADQKFRRRRTVTMALVLLGLAAFVLGYFVVRAAMWGVAGGTALVLAGYLFYLSRTVRIERQIAARRAARLQRNRMIRPQISRPAPLQSPATAYPPQATHVHRTRMAPPAPASYAMVEVDDDSPAFDDLDYYRPVVYRRAVGQ